MKKEARKNIREFDDENQSLSAQREIAKHTKKTAEILKDGVGGGTLTFQ